MKKSKAVVPYEALTPQFQMIENPMQISQFAEIEAVLYLFMQNAPQADPAKAYLLFTQYQLIGATKCSPMEHDLQTARATLGCYRSQKYWQDALQKYRDDKYNAVRAFTFTVIDEALRVTLVETPYPYPFEKRKKEWESFWTEDFKDPEIPTYAEAGVYKYVYPNSDSGESDTVQVKFDESLVKSDLITCTPKKGRAIISITLEELLKTAAQMSDLCPGDPCYTILKTNILKKNQGGKVKIADKLTIQEVVNIIGMVGSGKSTLIKVLAFWCHQHDYRIAIVVDTVAEVLNLQNYLSSLHVNVSPLIGRNERLKYINQVTQPDESCLAKIYAQYLTPACLVDGMDEGHSHAIAFGKEPCYSLRKGRKNHLCPYFDLCPGTKMLRDCYTASVVLTTVAGFAASRVGYERETFLELIMRDFDLVIFDESDRVQKTLDQFFMPETSFNNYIRECAEDCSTYMRLSSKSREENLPMQRYDEMQRHSVTVLSCLIKSLHYELGAWKKITHGDPFSALTLLENLYKVETEYQIPKEIYELLYGLIDMQNEENTRKSTLWAVLETSCRSTDETLFNQIYQVWLNQMGTKFPRPDAEKTRRIQDARIKLIIRLIYFDHFIRDLSDAYDACHETAYGQNELFGFLQTRFRQQQYFLPSALCGNLFGLKKTDEEDIILFRQFAFGRSLMKDLPYLRTDSLGNPAGPHVMLLSGSSWAEGSYEYHINRPVSYILEADHEKREFLEKTRFFESGFPERVSGSGEDDRIARLKTVTEKATELIMREYARNAGKILLVVNSYAQTQVVQEVLEAQLRKASCNVRVCRMISDNPNDKYGPGTIRRGEVSRFAYMSEEILIAPALAIERGHNIVDERGHSALSAVFFLVRPMSVPDDIQQKGSKLNGYVESKCKRLPTESVFTYNMRIRNFAAQQWAKVSKTKAFGLTELDQDERRDIVATLFVLILQIFGRLARVTDVTKPEPHVYFIDGAFRGREGQSDDFDCLAELGRYLENLMTNEESAAIAETLYAPFYKAYRKDIAYER